MFKAACLALMVGAPLVGVWVASSLAAFANRATWLPAFSGLLLFPILPLVWDAIAVARRRSATRLFLTFADRLVLRTLAINLVFLGGLLALYPSRAFVAISARGDWMLDGRSGPAVEKIRHALITSAGALEWLYLKAHDNPYREDKPTPSVTPTPSGSSRAPVPPPSPKPTSTSTPIPSPTTTPTPTTPGVNTYPFPRTLHPVVQTIPREAEATIESVGRYIAAHEADPVLRVKALHDWVVDRIAYDAPAYAAHNVPYSDGDAQSVFERRVGVCAGYARLLAALGKASGDEILYITGDARSYMSPMEAEGHAWNAVRIHERWYLIDATWNAGSVDNGTFTKRYVTDYFLSPPDQFAVTHFPDEAKWQLLESPLSRVDFFRRPVLSPTFFTHGLSLENPDRSQVSVADSLGVTIRNPRGAFVLVHFAPKNGGAKVDCGGNGHTQFRCDFPTRGTYDVSLFVNDQNVGMYDFGGSVEVNAR